MRAESLAEQLFFTTCHISATAPNGGWVGTGFVYAVETNAGTAHFLVTNKHVLAGASTVTVRFIQQDDGDGPLLGKATQMTIEGFNDASWVGHPDPAVDVAAMSLSAIVAQMHSNSAPPFFRSLSPDLCLGVGAAIETDALESVTFVGYPSGLFDTKNFLPIARRGSTATPIEVDYQGAPAFLIDASVFPGSSGSPVFIADRGMYTDRAGNTTIGSRLACLGVLAAVHTRSVSGEVENVPTKLMATFDEPIDLGIVYKARCFDECAQQFIEAAGLTRMPGPAPLAGGSAPTDADTAVAKALD